MTFEKFNRPTSYLGILLLFILIGTSSISLLNKKNDYESEKLKEDSIKLSPAPDGYQWYLTEEGGFAFLYPSEYRVAVCEDEALCTILGTVTGGLLLHPNPNTKITPGGEGGYGLWKRTGTVGTVDMYPFSLTVTRMDDESRMDTEEAKSELNRMYKDVYKKPNPIFFGTNKSDIYNADFMKPLPHAFLFTKKGIFKISTMANDPMQNTDIKICSEELSNECVDLMPSRNYEDYGDLPKNINTIIQSFTILE